MANIIYFVVYFTKRVVLVLGRGILARDCLSAEEREKINMVDEKLRQLQEESDVDYLSKVNSLATHLYVLWPHSSFHIAQWNNAVH